MLKILADNSVPACLTRPNRSYGPKPTGAVCVVVNQFASSARFCGDQNVSA